MRTNRIRLPENTEKTPGASAPTVCGQSALQLNPDLIRAPSHVLTAMGLSDDQVTSALRVSWCHLMPDVDWDAVVSAIKTKAA